MKDISIRVENELTTATEVKELEKNDRVIYVYIGRPNSSYPYSRGTEPRIQLNDKYAKISGLGPHVIRHIGRKYLLLSRGVVTVALKVYKKDDMGLISDVK